MKKSRCSCTRSRRKKQRSNVKHFASFTDCISKINNNQVDNTKGLDLVMPMYNLIHNNNNFSKHLEVYGNITEMSQMILL